MKETGLEYFKKMNHEVRKLNTTVITKVTIDENKIVDKVAAKMARGLSQRTTESIGI